MQFKLYYVRDGGSDDGRITFCKIAFNGFKFALICASAQNSFDQHIYDSLASILLDLPEYQLLTLMLYGFMALTEQD